MQISLRKTGAILLAGRARRGLRAALPAVPRLAARGCSLVELLVAIVVFTLGALSLAGSTAVALSRLSIAHVRATSAASVSSRFATLASTPCSALAPGSSQLAPRLTESWSVQSVGAGLARARVTLRFEPDAHDEVFEATIRCR